MVGSIVGMGVRVGVGEGEIEGDWQNWLKKNYEELQQLILSEESEITMGMQILSCEKGSL